ncbi:Crp/Fnr family transcriptional regulator [Ferdinandcohnia quinoae]|uniref:Crp/Fnr family transcriptional regulator n=1 Tax=Fredinandcohnia quinoae TaxID=2918902 RepID=A0AAW5DUY9_9BACI|nr:Crp/Fnr family transcriptional regulator [Fredinandcohnia sp. SECRCQ15]MCH1624451.1 Crp/Fnr family transcriptional regulator [Fredinandcohnia sp. SECRCQ15]
MEEILMKYLDKYTTLTDAEQQAIINELIIVKFKKGTYLIKQGDSPSKKCFFVLKGCVRQYYLDEDGKEVTSNFYTEEQAILLFNDGEPDQSSDYSLICQEDCVLVVADLESEQKMYKQYTELETMTRSMMENFLAKAQNEHAKFIRSSPEARYKMILQNRPDLLKRVPQHQLATYLGMTPESLSRIKKRIQ